MKKVLALISILSMLCCFTACGTSSVPTRASNDDESVVSDIVSEEEEEVSENEEESEAESETESEEESEAESEVSESEAESEAESESEESSEASSEEESENEDEDGAFEYGGISIVLPEGFTVDDSTDTLAIAYPETYPEETDNINFTKTNESINLYSEANINKTMKTLFEDYSGCKNYKQFKIDGCDAVTYDHTITVSGAEVSQRQVAVFADNTVIITFTSITGNYDDAYQKAIDSIKVVK